MLRACLKRLHRHRRVVYPWGMEPRKPYPTDLNDKEWDLIKHLVPTAKSGGRPEKYPKREILNGIFSVVRGGGAWRLLPHDFPPWQIVYHYFWRWRHDGPWQLMHDLLRGDVRAALGKRRQPSAGIIDSQSVKTTEKGGSAGTMRTSTSRGASDTSWSIPSG
jgi:putative transposase